MTVSDRYFENSDVEPNEKNEIPLHLDLADLTSDWLPAVTITVNTKLFPISFLYSTQMSMQTIKMRLGH